MIYIQKIGKVLALAASALLFVTVIYTFGMQTIYVVAALAGMFFALGSIGAFLQLFTLEAGSGSLLTALVLGIPILSGLAALLLWYGLDGLGWW